MKQRETKIVNGVTYIKCNKCGEFKEASTDFFSKNHLGFMGLQGDCKICVRIRQREYDKNNKDKLKVNRKRFYDRHKDDVLKKSKEWRDNNKQHFLEKCREYRDNNKEFYKDYMEEYRNEHKDELREKRVNRDLEKGYISIHNKTNNLIRKLKIKPNICPICNKEKRVYSHHPNYDKWNEVVFCCQSCHGMIHSGAIKCPKPINLLEQ